MLCDSQYTYLEYGIIHLLVCLVLINMYNSQFWLVENMLWTALILSYTLYWRSSY